MQRIKSRMWRRIASGLACAAILVGLTSCHGRSAADADFERAFQRLRKALFLQLGDEQFQEVAQLLEDVVARDPSNASAYCNLGMAYWRLNMHEEAVEAMKTAADLTPTDPRPLEFLAQAFIEWKNWDRARLTLDRAFQRDSESPSILTAMAVVEAKTGNPSRAHELLMDVLDIEPNYPPALYNLAILHRDYLNNPAAVDTYFRKYLVVAEDDALKADLPPNALPDQGHIDAALHHLQSGRNAPPAPQAPSVTRRAPPERTERVTDPSESEISKARRAIAEHAYDRALIMLKNMLRANPDNPDALWELACLYDIHLQQPDQAVELYAAFRAHFRDDSRSALAQAALQRIRTESVAADTETTEAESGYDPEAALRLWTEGLERQNGGEWEAAIDLYKRALELDGSLISAAYNLGLVYKETGQLQLAQEAFAKSVKLKPDMVEGHYMLGVTAREMGQDASAITHLQHTLELNPDYGMAHFVLGLVYREQDRFSQAATHFKKAIALMPGSPHAKQAERLLQDMASR